MVSGKVSALFEKKDSHRNRDLRALGLGEIIGEVNLGVRRLFPENAHTHTHTLWRSAAAQCSVGFPS